MQATQPEMAAFFDMSSPDSRASRQAAQGPRRLWSARNYLKGKISIRRKHMQVAEAGNVTILIWLGKQVLGQRDQIDSRLSNPDGSPLISLAAWRELVKAAKKRRCTGE